MDADDVIDRAEVAVTALLPVLPLNGSWAGGYTVSERIDARVVALPEEWGEAAQAIADLHAALSALDEKQGDAA